MAFFNPPNRLDRNTRHLEMGTLMFGGGGMPDSQSPSQGTPPGSSDYLAEVSKTAQSSRLHVSSKEL